MPTHAERTIRSLLANADIAINGSRPWDIQVHNKNLYGRILSQGSLGLGESYMNGWWDSSAMDIMLSKVFEAKLERSIPRNLKTLFSYLLARFTNRQSRQRAFQIGEAHYDIGNDLYEGMLDQRLTYTCGYWKNANTLDQAQEAKLDLVCKKLV